jgi:hypothetical protein
MPRSDKRLKKKKKKKNRCLGLSPMNAVPKAQEGARELGQGEAMQRPISEKSHRGRLQPNPTRHWSQLQSLAKGHPGMEISRYFWHLQQRSLQWPRRVHWRRAGMDE